MTHGVPVAAIRQLPSGNWNAQVRLPNGKVASFTDPLKKVVKADAAELERDIRRKDWIDPRGGECTFDELWDIARGARVLATASKARDASHWRNHVQPRWGHVRLKAVDPAEVSTWIVSMQENGVGVPTIEGSLKLLKAMLAVAVDKRLIRASPARKVSAPTGDTPTERVFAAEEEEAFLDRLEALFPGRLDARLFVEFMFETGCRWEEAAAVHAADVDTIRGLIKIYAVVERDRTVRMYPKSSTSVRTVAVSREYLTRLRLAVLAAPPGGLVFRSREGKTLHYRNWLKRVWQRGLLIEEPDVEAAAAWVRPPGRCGAPPKFVRKIKLLADPQPTPHDCRHTFATRLGDAGVPQHDIMPLLGHGDARSTRRYLHSSLERFEKACAANRQARGHKSETEDAARAPHARVHTLKKASIKTPREGS